jgi:glucose/arabinose dehydrogenase
MSNPFNRSLPGAALVLALGILGPASARAAVPSGFTDELVASVGSPTGLAFTPDGRLLIATQGGALRVYASGALLSTPALNLSSVICANSERGLLGVAVDPEFETNRFIYVYYTFRQTGTTCPTSSLNVVNRVSRFVLPDSNVVSLASETVLVDNIHSWAGNHNAGDVHFGKDGYLYISVGDGGSDYAGDSGGAGANDAARDTHVLLGKILRVTRDGGIPPSNPWQGTGTARCNVTGSTTVGNRCQETFAWGLRNPFRMAFDPGAVGTRFFINDVGQGAWEEIDEGVVGADYGWNCREGAHTNSTTGKCAGTPPSPFRDPIHEYDRGTGCASITGGAFVPTGSWPTAFNGDYMFADYVCGQIFRLESGPGGYSRTSFGTGLGSVVHMLFGTDGLFYTTYSSSGQVRRIRYTGTDNRAPVARISATPVSGAAPLLVSFDGSASSDPDSGDLVAAWIWDFGDGTPEFETVSPTTTHTYSVAGTYTAVLRVRDVSEALSDPATILINAGNSAPQATILTPLVTDRLSVGQTMTLQGQATDPEQGTLPAASLSWTVLLHHASHTHPFFGPVTGNNINVTYPSPEDLSAAANSYLSVHLTATDALGATSTVTLNAMPRTTNITFATQPTGLQLSVNGTSFPGPQTFVSWVNYGLNVDVPTQSGFTFGSWSDGGARAHTIVTPATATTYTATHSPSVGLSVNDVSVTEGHSGTTAASFTVTLSGASSQTVSASYSTANGTATSGSDYVATAGTVTFPSGSTSQPVVVNVNGDTTVEGNETFLVNLSSPTNATLTDGQGVGTINNDDSVTPPVGEGVVWTSGGGVTIAGNSLTKTAATGWGNAGAVSNKHLTAGDGSVTVTGESTTHRIFGLSNGDTNRNWDDIDFGFYLNANGQVQIYERGILRGSFGAYGSGDLLRVAVEGGVVRYRKNGALLFTSPTAPTYPLLVDTSLYTQGATLANAVLSGTWE